MRPSPSVASARSHEPQRGRGPARPRPGGRGRGAADSARRLGAAHRRRRPRSGSDADPGRLGVRAGMTGQPEEPEEEEAPRVWNSGPKLTHTRPDRLDETVRIEISLTRRQWQILDEVRGGTARGRYLWSFLSDALRETFG